MPVYKIDKSKLEPLSKRKFDLEKDIQKLTEQNLDTVFGLQFISGGSTNEFSVSVTEQDFYIDTLAFDEDQKSFVIIEYKKDKSFSVIDQGFAYLSAMLNHKADFVLELNEKLDKHFKKSEIDWEASRVIFVSPEFTNYQRNAINFEDLPIFLYEVKLYDNNIIEYDPIKPYKTTVSISRISKDKTIQSVSRQVKSYSQNDLVKPSWKDTLELLDIFQTGLYNEIPESRIKYTKLYIAFISKHGRNFVEIVPQESGLKIYFRFPYNHVKSELNIEDCSKKGRWANGISYVQVRDLSEIQEVLRLSTESYKYLHKDIKPS